MEATASRSAAEPTLVHTHNTRRSPLYIINNISGARDPRVDLLLGEKLETSSFALGRFREGTRRPDKPMIRLKIKSDAVGGLTLPRVSAVNDVHDIGECIGGRLDWKAVVRSCRAAFGCTIELVDFKDAKIRASVVANEPTVVIPRQQLLRVATALQDKEADPYFGQVELIRHDFLELVRAVKGECEKGSYLIID